jgi:hypothetical protein
LITNIRNKLVENELTITKADKGKPIVILASEDYKQNVNNFIKGKQFGALNSKPTKCYQNYKTNTSTMQLHLATRVNGNLYK